MRRELDSTHCQKMVYGGRDVWGHQCRNKPTVTRDGKLYCRIHDPEYIAEKRRKEHATFKKKWQARHSRDTLNQARLEATKGLTLEELRRVTPDMIRTLLTREEV